MFGRHTRIKTISSLYSPTRTDITMGLETKARNLCLGTCKIRSAAFYWAVAGKRAAMPLMMLDISSNMSVNTWNLTNADLQLRHYLYRLGRYSRCALSIQWSSSRRNLSSCRITALLRGEKPIVTVNVFQRKKANNRLEIWIFSE